MNQAILTSAVLNFVNTTTLLLTVISALFLGIYTGYWSIRGILYAFGRHSASIAKAAKVVPFPASAASAGVRS